MLKHLLMTVTLALMISAPVLAQNATPEASAQVTNLRDLVGHDNTARRAVLSPDGNKIAWQDEDNLCLYTIDTASTHCALMPDDYASYAPALVWSADSSKLAFTQDFFRFLNEPDLYTYDVQHDRFANLTDDGSHVAPTKVDETVPADILPTWSPLGDLYWWRSYKQKTPTQSVYRFGLMNAPQEVQNLTRLIPGPYSVTQQPAISPDGTTMAFIVIAPERANPNNGLYTLNLKSGAVERIALLDDLRVNLPAWADLARAMPSAVAWSGANLVVTMGNVDPTSLPEPENALYIALPSKQITPLFDTRAYATQKDFVIAWDQGQPENAAILRTGVVSGDGKQFLFLHTVSQGTVSLSSLPLPPDGSTPTPLVTTDWHIGASEPVAGANFDGSRVLLDGKLFLIHQ